jgi:hypothetical protein
VVEAGPGTRSPRTLNVLVVIGLAFLERRGWRRGQRRRRGRVGVAAGIAAGVALGVALGVAASLDEAVAIVSAVTILITRFLMFSMIIFLRFSFSFSFLSLILLITELIFVLLGLPMTTLNRRLRPSDSIGRLT